LICSPRRSPRCRASSPARTDANGGERRRALDALHGRKWPAPCLKPRSLVRHPCSSLLLVACLSGAVPGVSRADDPPRAPDSPAQDLRQPVAGLQFGARIGYALPTGMLSHGSALQTHLSDLETASVPLGIDAGYRFSPRFYLGGTLAWGPGISPNSGHTCPGGDSCFRQNAELRFDARVYLTPETPAGWWVAFGAGWEVAAFSQSYRGAGVTSTLTGPVFADFQLGRDWGRGPVVIGPYLGLSLAEYVTEGVNPAVSPVSTWISDPSLHTWITLGLRGSYGPL